MQEQAIVDCASGATTYAPLSPAEQTSVASQQAQAQLQEEALAAALAFRQVQARALAGVQEALQRDGPSARADAAALGGLVHKLVAAPVQPLSAPEVCTLLRVVLRCLLP